MTGLFRAGLVAICLLLPSGPAVAQAEAADPWPKFELAVGGFVTESDTTVQINSETLGVGAGVNAINYFVENDVDTSLANLAGSIRFQLTGLMVYLNYFF